MSFESMMAPEQKSSFAVSQRAAAERVPRRERDAERLEQALAAWSDRLNATLHDAMPPDAARRAGDILDTTCRIDMRAFMTKRGGPYAKEAPKADTGNGRSGIAVLADEQLVHEQEVAHSGAREPWAARHYGTDDEEAILATWRTQESRRDGTLAEATVLCVLNKYLGDRYVAVRAAAYDDYVGGVDMLILDRTTGGVVCAVDDMVGDDTGDRHAHKVDRARQRLAQRGGMRVRYGLALAPDAAADGGKTLVRGALPHTPGFCISLTHDDLRALVATADLRPGTRRSTAEDRLMTHIADALGTQRDAAARLLTPEQRTHVDDLLAHATASVQAAPATTPGRTLH